MLCGKLSIQSGRKPAGDLLSLMTSSSHTVIFGAGNLGRRLAQAVQPVLFCDNNPALWGSVCEGISVESPETAVRRYPNATFVIAIWHPTRPEGMMDRISQLKSLGASNVTSFAALINDFGNLLLPHGFWERPGYYAEHSEEISSVRALLDAKGREEFDRQMRLRLGDVSGQVIDSGVQYFPKDVLQLSRNEVFIDCGAYDGDTIAEFRRATGHHFARIVAFEPDPNYLRTLVQNDYVLQIGKHPPFSLDRWKLSPAPQTSTPSKVFNCSVSA
jgi:hypothetical protein